MIVSSHNVEEDPKYFMKTVKQINYNYYRYNYIIIIIIITMSDVLQGKITQNTN